MELVIIRKWQSQGAGVVAMCPPPLLITFVPTPDPLPPALASFLSSPSPTLPFLLPSP